MCFAYAVPSQYMPFPILTLKLFQRDTYSLLLKNWIYIKANLGYSGLWVFVNIYRLRLKSPNKVISLMLIFGQRPTISEIHWFVFRWMVLVYRINCCSNSIFLVIFSVAWSPYVVKWKRWCLKSALLNATEHKTRK